MGDVGAVAKLIEYTVGLIADPLLTTWRTKREVEASRVSAEGQAALALGTGGLIDYCPDGCISSSRPTHVTRQQPHTNDNQMAGRMSWLTELEAC